MATKLDALEEYVRHIVLEINTQRIDNGLMALPNIDEWCRGSYGCGWDDLVRP